MKTSFGHAGRALVAWALFASVPAHSAVFTLEPGSGLDLSGTLAVDIGGALNLSGSGSLVGQPSGGLHANLTGTLLANLGPGMLTFPGGSTISAPGGFGFIATVPLSGSSGFGTATIEGTIQNLTFDLTGTTPLSGSPDDDFNTQGLDFTTLTGSASGTATVCITFFGCVSTPISIPDVGPESGVLPAGTGHLTRSGMIETLSLPVAFSFTETATESNQGITVTATLDLAVAGNLEGVRVIPEASTSMLLLIAMGGLAIACRSRRIRAARLV